MSKLPKFTFDLRERKEFDAAFGDEAHERIIEQVLMQSAPLDRENVRWWLDDYITDEKDLDIVVAAIVDGLPDDALGKALAEKYRVEEIQQAFQDADQHAYEKAMLTSDDDIERALEHAVDVCKGKEMVGVSTGVYWSGVLASYPWEEITRNEEAVIETVLDKAKVKGPTVTLTYAGTKYAPALLMAARGEDADDPDYGFGGNSEMELNTIWRHVAREAVEFLEGEVEGRFRNGISAHDELRELLTDLFKEEDN